ncbi:MAG TPA: SWIM zinc finger family protein [Rhodoferax sp.]
MSISSQRQPASRTASATRGRTSAAGAQPAKPGKTSKAAKVAKPVEPRLSRTRRPLEIEVADWQTALRRQFGREQDFGLKNLGQDPVFSDFSVSNPASGTHYRVAIRGQAPGQNFCTCPDYASNDLGTCKHIEFTLAKLQAKRGGKAALNRGFEPTYSEISGSTTRASARCASALAPTARRPC